MPLDELTPEQQKQYDETLAGYKPTGYFANRGIAFYKPCVVDGRLDEEKAMAVYGLNERQLPFLKIELEAAGYLEKASDTAAPTAPLDPEKKKAPKPVPAAEPSV